ncbi:3D domain-containing protein [Acetivibrio straminisolvens]|uniref:3D domain-containing protein n=1 Tax=Acetivibrio straminisolvens TaxID=253314 RepID=UPI002356DDDE|nr:3D domain-containing protein [Acetivibrio straminisolvens]
MEININLVLEELKNREILTQKNVLDIKNYISAQYPNHSRQRRAAIFADAVNKIINKNISSFSITYRDEIKKTLLRETVKKHPFTINANDVYQACLGSGFKEDNFINEISQWCGNILEKPYIKDVVKDYTLKLIIPAKTSSEVNEAVNNSAIDAKSDPSEKDNTIEPPADNVPAPATEATEEISIEEVSIAEETSTPDETAVETQAESNIPDICENGSKKESSGIKKIVIVASVLVLVIVSSCIALVGKLAKTADTMQTSTLEPSPSPSNVSIFNKPDVPDELNSKNTILSHLGYSSGLHKNVPKHKKVLYLTATAYDLSFESCGKTRKHPEYGITYTGTRAKVGRTVAVDPSVIPLGSEMYIVFPEEYSNLNGVYIAEDTGSLIKGSKIDIFFGEDKPGESIVNESAMKFGVRKVYVYILN